MNKDIVDLLAEKVLDLHSFEYNTLAEARKKVSVGKYCYCFDALSLSCYEHNLTPQIYHLFDKLLTEAYESRPREQQKERLERAILFHFLQYEERDYSNYMIMKAVRPDFILEGDLRIGVEITRFTTADDQILYEISRMQSKTHSHAKEAKEAAEKRFKDRAKQYNYWDIGNSTVIVSNLFDVHERKRFYAEEIKTKYKKYSDVITEFDRFFIVCEAEMNVDITDQYDVDEIYGIAKENMPDISNATVAILWSTKSGKPMLTEY